MGKTQKKNSKGRLDRYYYLAKEKGYRARSSFKIIQINEKYGHFLEKSKVVIDLCAAPGSWCQVASKVCPVNSLIIGVDIVPIKPLPNVITFQSDITTEDCKSKLRGYMKTWKADTVLHDGAPNVGLGWVQDAFTQSQLTLQALKLAVENLCKGGTFVTKIFRSRDYNNLMWVFQQLFEKVEATKPPASRNVSAEIFVVCKDFKAPKKLDPRLLDPREVFEELGTEKQNYEAKIYNPERKVRKRDGYAEGDYTLYHEGSLLDFVKSETPIDVLGSLNKLTIPDDNDKSWKILKKVKLCSPELLECIKDLKVLGRKDFKLILKFRKKAREILGLDSEEEGSEDIKEVAMTEDQIIDNELQNLTNKQRQKLKRAKKHANELKQKEIKRMQMNMLTDMNIGIEAGQIGGDSLFNLKAAEKTGKLDDLSKGKKRMVPRNDSMLDNTDIVLDDDIVEDSEDEINDLEDQLDDMYSSFKERRAQQNANYRSKLARGDEHDENWEGFESPHEDEDEEEYEIEKDSDSDSDDDEHIRRLAESARSKTLSKDAKVFFASDNIFGNLDESDLLSGLANKTQKSDQDNSADEQGKAKIEFVSTNNGSSGEEEYLSEQEMPKTYGDGTHGRDVEIATVEAMSLAHQVALGRMNKHDLVNEGINKYSFRDIDNLPDWFIEDEKKHSKLVKPITKEAALAIKEKEKQLNARPIKKVLEAQGRKKMRALKRLEKLKKKSDLINEDSGLSEKDKAEEIQKLMKKLTKKQKRKPGATVVVARGSNRGLSGRPKGVKGKYKMVDGVLKNEQRALRRITKKHKK